MRWVLLERCKKGSLKSIFVASFTILYSFCERTWVCVCAPMCICSRIAKKKQSEGLLRPNRNLFFLSTTIILQCWFVCVFFSLFLLDVEWIPWLNVSSLSLNRCCFWFFFSRSCLLHFLHVIKWNWVWWSCAHIFFASLVYFFSCCFQIICENLCAIQIIARATLSLRPPRNLDFGCAKQVQMQTASISIAK